jgi:hypothetical protein
VEGMWRNIGTAAGRLISTRFAVAAWGSAFETILARIMNHGLDMLARLGEPATCSFNKMPPFRSNLELHGLRIV